MSRRPVPEPDPPPPIERSAPAGFTYELHERRWINRSRPCHPQSTTAAVCPLHTRRDRIT